MCKLTHRKAYAVAARKLVRTMVLSGCARDKVGPLICEAAKMYGISIKNSMSRRTVSRIMLEGYIASKSQLGYEIGQANGKKDLYCILEIKYLTISKHSPLVQTAHRTEARISNLGWLPCVLQTTTLGVL